MFHDFMANRWENNENSDTLFSWTPKLLWMDGDYSHEIKTLAPWRKNYDKPRQHIKKQTLLCHKKVHIVKAMVFFSSHVWIWELDHKKGRVPKNWCLWTVVLENTLESPLDCKEIQPVNPQGNQSWIFIRRTDTEAEVPILWPPDANSRLIGKDPDAGKDWRQEEKGMTEDEMVGWHHRLNGYEFEQALGNGEGQGSLACCSPWGHRESTTTERQTITITVLWMRKQISGWEVCPNSHQECRFGIGSSGFPLYPGSYF